MRRYRRICSCNIFWGTVVFTNKAPFFPTLFVEIRGRLTFELLSKINEVIAVLSIEKEAAKIEQDQQLIQKNTRTPAPGEPAAENKNDKVDKILPQPI